MTVLIVDDDVLFESNAIAEYLDEVVEPRLAPSDPIKRAQNRAWTDFTSGWAGALGKVNYAKTKEEHAAALSALPTTLYKIEDALGQRINDGPFFNGGKLSLVDAAYAPFLMRFDIVEKINPTGVLENYNKIKDWSSALLKHDAVIGSVSDDFLEVFEQNLRLRETLASKILDGESITAA